MIWDHVGRYHDQGLSNDLVYKKNIQELIERNRPFEKHHEPDTEFHDNSI
jgi:hypothetical protein